MGSHSVFGTMVGHWRIAGAALVLALVSVPASAQVDLNGGWQSLQHEDWVERAPGSDPVDYTGIALTDAGRARALSYSYAEYSMLERQLHLLHPVHSLIWGPQGLRIWSEANPVRGTVVAWKISSAVDRDVVTIWMDGRPHPSENAFYPFSGFTTGRWEGNVLVAHTRISRPGSSAATASRAATGRPPTGASSGTGTT